MTLVSLPSPIHWPGIFGSNNGGPSVGTLTTVSSAGHYAAYVLCAKEDMTISHVGFRNGTATGSPTGEVRIETIDASGLPSGTLWATNTNATSGTLTANTFNLLALTASASIPKGSMFCVKIAYASGTSFIISSISNANINNYNSETPYSVLNTGTPTKGGLVNGCGLIALGSSSTTFYQVPGLLPVSSTAAGTYNNTNSAKRGLRFTPPMNCRTIGVRWFNGQAGDFNAAIYGDAGSELSSSSTAFDGDASAANGNLTRTVYFDNPVTLSAGTTYRVAIEPTSATNVNITTLTLPSANYRGASPAGTAAHYTTFASGAWDDTNTAVIPCMDILIDQVDDGAGSGGGGGQRVISG